MGKIYFWMTIPDRQIPETVWAEFLNGMAAWTIAAIATGIALTVLLYAVSARQKKIYFPGDVFSSYTPLWWIALAVPVSCAVCWVCLWQYPIVLNTEVGEFGTALQMAVTAAVITAFLSYLVIVFVPGITPAKFMHRAGRLWRRKSAAGAA